LKTVQVYATNVLSNLAVTGKTFMVFAVDAFKSGAENTKQQ